MKRTLTLLLAAILLFQFAACEKEEKEPTETNEAVTTEEDNSLKTPGIAALSDEDKAAYQALIAKNTERALKVGNTIEKYYLTGKGGNMTMAMKVSTSGSSNRRTGTASVWHYTAVLAMTSRLQALNAGGQGEHFAELYGSLLSSMDYYKGTGNVVDYSGTKKQTMYAVDRASSKGKASLSGVSAVYDDQMWIIREMIYAYRLTHNEEYLNLALSLTQTCLDGWDTTLDSNGKEYGGICWGPGYSSKHTCSNAPLIEPLVDLYEIFVDEGRENANYYLEWAEKIYKWTSSHLILGNGLYGDAIGSERETEGSGKNAHYVTTSQSKDMDRSTYTYNTGAMISAAVALYRVTGTTSYLTTAKRSAKAAYQTLGNHKVMDGYVLYPFEKDTTWPWFNLVLLEGYIDLFPYDEACKIYIDSMQATLDYAYDNFVTEKGFIPRNFLLGWDDKSEFDKNKDVMDQASFSEMYSLLAQFYASLGE